MILNAWTQNDYADIFALSIMPANALATLFEALSVCFADRPTDTKELLYLCSACTQGNQVNTVA